MTPTDRLGALLVVAIWGLNFVAVKLGVGKIPPLLLMTLRFAVVGLVLAPFFRPPLAKLPQMIGVAFTLGVLHFGMLFAGIKLLDAASAAIVIQLSVPFSALCAAYFFGDRLGWVRGLGMVLAFAGIALLAGEPTRPDPMGLLLVGGAAFAWAVANVQLKKMGSVNPLAVNGWVALAAVPMLLAASLIFEQGQVDALRDAGWIGWGSVAYTALGASVVAYTLWYRLIAKYPVNEVVPFTMLGPVIGVAAGVLLLGDPLTWEKMVGAVITLTGVAAIQFHERILRWWR